VTEAQILDLARYRESEAFSALEKAVLDYAVALSQTPANASDALVARLRDELSDEQLVELTAAIAWENFRARFNRGFDVAAQGFSRGAVCPIPERPMADRASP
jgi:alkylhydroperoxidase family enzyme